MEDQDAPLDMLSDLPLNLLQIILTLMPMRDAFRTSILSRNWRNHCLTIPKLSFDYKLFRGSAYGTAPIKCILSHVVFPILLLHQGPILDFSLFFPSLKSCCEIDQIILHLSRNDTLKKFHLSIMQGAEHELLPAFFKLQHLTVLTLHKCAFQPPVTFKGFSRLVCLSLNYVSITGEVFERMISNCPLLKQLGLYGFEENLKGSWNFDFVKLFERLPLLERLYMDGYPIKCFATCVMPQKLPTALVHLKCLYLSFMREIDFQAALLLVTNSPNIEIIELEMEGNPTEAMSQTAMDLIDQQDYSYMTLDHLCDIHIVYFTNMKMVTHFVKFILAKSPVLKNVEICIDKQVDIHVEVKMLKELLRYPRASASAESRVDRA